MCDACEYIVLFVSELACIDLVEQLHEYKQLECNCVNMELRSGITDFNHALELGVLVHIRLSHVHSHVRWVLVAQDLSAKEKRDEDSNDLVESLTKYITPHDGVNDLIITLVRLSLQKIVSRGFCGKGQGSEGVHNQIDP